MIYKIKNYIRKVSNENRAIRVIYLISNKAKVNILNLFNDRLVSKIMYYENTGKKLNLDDPRTFNEKLWWLKINNRDPLLTLCSDKVLVRDYVRSSGLEHILNKVYGVFDDINEIDFSKLPSPMYIKTNNGSGSNFLWNNQNTKDLNSAKRRLSRSMNGNYYLQSREWNYKHIEPKIMIEKVLVDPKNSSLVDYRFLCFDGKVKLIFVDIETADSEGKHSPYAKRNVYDREMNLLPLKAKRDTFDDKLITFPKNIDRMIGYAEKLSDPFVFCRVDFYNIDEKIYFGEITFYPGGGTQLIEPSEYELSIGEWIDLDSEKIVRKDGLDK